MSDAAWGQDLRFRATDPVPPMNGPTFAAEDIDDLGVELCLTVWHRLQKPMRGISLDEWRRKNRRWWRRGR